MGRLTDKDDNKYWVFDTGVEYPFDLLYNALQKLGQLEDFEEELGIDLMVLFKALKNGIYLRAGYASFDYPNEKWAITAIINNIGYFNNHLEVALFERYKGDGNKFESKNREYCPFDEIKTSDVIGTYASTDIFIDDYGKTWALTKEELE